MKTSKILKSFIVFLLFYSNIICAQIPTTPVNIQSPNVASLGMYGNYPVSYFTGVPDIQIPLYTVQNKGASVPISLSYHASGFRPDMHPGWVGMGFNLNAGGVISRNIKSVPDDYNNAGCTNGPGGAKRGYYWNHFIISNSNALDNANWDQTSYLQFIVANGTGITAAPFAAEMDQEPDEFSFNFGAYSGSFYMNSDGTWKVKSDKPLTVTFNGVFISNPFGALTTNMQTCGNTQCFSGFTITTEDGTQYVFGGTTDAIEYSINFYNQEQIGEWEAGSWYLTEIVDADGQETNLTYHRDNYINQMGISVSENLATSLIDPSGQLGMTCNSFSFQPLNNFYDGQLIAPVYLQQITTPNVVVKFNRSTSTELRYNQNYTVNADPNDIYYTKANAFDIASGPSGYFGFLPILSSGAQYTYYGGGSGQAAYAPCLDSLKWKELNSIVIQNTNGTVLKSFNFNYNNNVNERLTLESLVETGSDGTANPPYQFYYNQFSTAVPAPPYLSNMTDHWGFYNGTYADISGSSISSPSVYYAYRQPNAAFLLAGTLNEIAYPTGGKTDFTFEPNYYQYQVGLDRTQVPPLLPTNLLAGGLRIKEINSYDPANPSQNIEKQYYYVSNYTNSASLSTLSGSGVLGGQIQYSFSNYQIQGVQVQYFQNPPEPPVTTNEGGILSSSIFSSQSVLPGCVNAQGSHIGYSQVVEKLNDGSYKIYHFSNFDNGRTDEAADNTLQITHTAYEPYTSNEEERGKLLEEDAYDVNDHPISSHQLQYVAFNKASSYVPSVKAQWVQVPCGEYSLTTQQPIAVVFEEGTAYKLYYYSYLPITETNILYNIYGNGATTTKNYIYNNLKLLSSKTEINSRGETELTNYKYPADITSSDPSFSTTQSMVAANIVSPVIEASELNNNNPVSLMHTNYYAPYPTIFAPQSIQLQTAGNPIETRQQYYQYDPHGNIWELSKTGDAHDVYLWGYNSFYPVAKITNTTLAAVQSVMSANSITQTQLDNAGTLADGVMRTLLNYLRVGLPNSQVSTYTYTPNIGMTSSTDAKGEITFYEYDNFLRLMNIKDTGGNIIKHYDYHYQGQ